jgi:serine-type D-Ala-D-Ala carboxypeptidase/endopeptidase (penicillin-binding protein 4)
MIGASGRLFKLLVGALAVACTAAGAADLPPPVLQALRAAKIPPSSVYAVVQPLDAARPSIARNANVPVNPASVMKLVTTYAALELLGPAYRWKTEVYVDGNDVVLRGYGDPKLTHEGFWLLLRALRSRGYRHIAGDFVLDRSWFAPVPDGPLDDEAFRPYNVTPDALLISFKSLRFSFLPDGDTVKVFAEPVIPGLEIQNRLKVVEGPACPDGRAFRALIGASFQPQPPRAAFTGAYPATCGERDLNVALHTPEDYAAGMIKQLWGELGGTLTGSVREGTTPPQARLVYTHESQPLGEVVRDINKFSNNVMARQLYLTLAAELGGAPAEPQNAEQAIREWLARRRIPTAGVVLENGSGLSRQERASAATLAALLQAAWQSAVMPEFIASLPVAATDGTMRKRLLGERVTGHAHIKTGLLHDTRAIAGYVLDRRGRRHAVVMIVSHPRAVDAQAALDALLSWVYEAPTGRGRTTGHPPGGAPRHP